MSGKFQFEAEEIDELDNTQFKVCRVCLVANVKMYDLQEHPLDTHFEAVIGIPVMSTMDLPMFLCFECAGLVRKFSLYKEKCLRGQATLYGLMQNDVKLSMSTLSQLDRKRLQLQSTCSTSDLVTIQCLPDDNYTTEVVHSNNKVKNEPINPQFQFEVDIEDGTGEFEEKFSLDDSFQDGGHSSDDEPLAVHKSNKTIHKDDDTEVINGTFSDTQKEIETNEPVPVPVRKRGRPKKTDTVLRKKIKKSHNSYKPRRTANTGGVDDFDINIEDYVTVIKLTMEEQLDELNKRKESENYTTTAFQCNLCYRGFLDTNAWKHHLKKHDPSSGNIECPVCKFRFQTKRALQKHTVNHSQKFVCKSCSFVSKTCTQAKQHQRWHKGVTYKCQYCDDIYTQWTSYLSHIRLKHPSQHICGICGYSFVSELGLTMHKTLMHKDFVEESTEGPYCQECDVKFVSTESYNRHMVTSIKHSRSEDLSCCCRVCGLKFQCSEDMRLHHRKEHARKRPKNYGKKPGPKEWPAKCEHCPEMIGNARDYWTHFRRAHPGENYPIPKNYVCDICGRSFRDNANLTYHKRTHSTERQFSCATCGKAFYNRSNLGTHLRTHSDLRPHACRHCHKAFKNKSALDRHFRSHTGEKPYECEVCGKAFAQSNSRKLHVRTVHLKQPAPYVSKARLEKKKASKEQAGLAESQYLAAKPPVAVAYTLPL